MILHTIMSPLDITAEQNYVPPAYECRIRNSIPSFYETSIDKGIYFAGQKKLIFSTNPSDWLKEKYTKFPEDKIL